MTSLAKIEQAAPLNIGTEVRPYGEIVAIGCLNGDRYYWLIDKYGSVAMMPADAIEKK